MSEAGSHSHVCAHCAREEERERTVDMRSRYVVAVVGGTAFLLGLLSQYVGAGVVYSYAFLLVAMLVSGRWTIPRGLRGAARLHLDTNFLMTFAAAAAMVIGAPTEGAAVMFLFFIADLLEHRTDRVVHREIESLLALERPTVTVKVDGAEVCMDVEEVEVGSVMLVRPGERIGLDGRVVAGTSSVDEAPITGESLPVTKGPGDDVFAGTLNQEGYLEVEVTRWSDDTVLARTIKLVRETEEHRAPTELLVSRVSHMYTPVVVALAISVSAISALLGTPLVAAVYRGLTLLVISCPCAFAISIPVSMVSALGGAARSGVLVKGPEYIEHLSRTRTVAFDKTGTLTQGQLGVEGVCVHDAGSEDEVLTAAASLGQMSEHPVSMAIADNSRERGLTLSRPAEFRAVPGKGMIGRVGDERYAVGNLRLLDEQDVAVGRDHMCGVGTSVYVARDGQHLGTIILGDQTRGESRETVQLLHRMGIRTVMLTGDNEHTARRVAEGLGIEEFYAGLLPEDKVAMVRQLRKEGAVVMVGDGINDAPALAAADVGVALGAASSDIALEAADVAVMGDDLRRIPAVIDRARRTMRVVRQNVGVSLSVKVLLTLLSIAGLVGLWVAVLFGDVGLTLAVVANAMRLVRAGPATNSPSGTA